MIRIASLAAVLTIAASLAGTLAGAALAAERNTTVKFDKGAHAKMISGSIRGDTIANYIVATVPGQTMQMLFKANRGSCSVNVYAPGTNDSAVHIGETAGNEYGTNVVTAGNYRFSVGMMRADARRNATCRYQLSLEITGASGGASAGVSDLMMQDLCKGNAAPMYGVEPRNITTVRRIVKTATGYSIDGTVNKGAEGIKKLRCIFRPDRTFSNVMAMTPDGRL